MWDILQQIQAAMAISDKLVQLEVLEKSFAINELELPVTGGKMHELFLTTTIPNHDVPRAIKILQGYCAMKPQTSLSRRLIWEGPKQRTGLKGIPTEVMNNLGKQNPAKLPFWKLLHESLLRQSFVVSVIYEVEKGTFGEGWQANGAALTCDQSLGMLRWNDLPDPQDARPVNTRPMLQIESERNLCSTMQQIGYRFTAQMIQECHLFINGNVIFELSRYLQLSAGVQPDYNSPLPDLESLHPFDDENKWILMISVRVVNGKDPEQVQQGVSELMGVKNDFEGCFNFHMVDRHTLDTRTRMN